MKITIIGAGISGISAGYHLDNSKFEVELYESRNSWGGLLDNFTTKEGFRFDTFIHLSFTQNHYVKNLFNKSSESIIHNPVSYNLSNGKWIKHPAQFNLSSLDFKEKLKILNGFFGRGNYKEVNNYKDWLFKSYGKYFSENYSQKYTRKYWTTDAENLGTDWLGARLNVPNLSQIIKGSLFKTNENFYYAKEMRYPKKGGYKSYLNYMTNNLKINLNKKVVLIDNKNKKIIFEDGKVDFYEKLISTIPLPELIKIIKDVPNDVKNASEKLLATSAQLVSIGFNKVIEQPLWYYIYDEDFIPSRAWAPNLKSPDNTPLNKSSVQFESYFSKLKPKKFNGDYLIDHIIKKSKKNNLFSENDIECIDYREIKYANVIFDFNRKKNLKIIHDYLDRKNIFYCGRFGEWDYLWSDQSLLSGRSISKKINNLI